MRQHKHHINPLHRQNLLFVSMLLPLMILVGTTTVLLSQYPLWQFNIWDTGQDEEQEFQFIIQQLNYPDWFKNSHFNLQQDLKEAKQADKRGIAIYFGRENCACCEVMLEVNLQTPDIANYMKRFFDVIAIDTTGENMVTTFDGQQMPEARFALEQKADATPSILFYDTNGKLIYHLLGYYPRYEFRAALDYVIGRQYISMTFSQYLKHLGRPLLFSEFELHHSPLFASPPYNLDRSQQVAQRPLAVFFERGNCPGCDLFHSSLMKNPVIYEELEKMDIIQLEIDSDTPLITPDGRQLTAVEWATELEIDYAPTLVFFDQQGKQISTIQSIAQWNHLPRYLKYLVTGVYK